MRTRFVLTYLVRTQPTPRYTYPTLFIVRIGCCDGRSEMLLKVLGTFTSIYLYMIYTYSSHTMNSTYSNVLYGPGWIEQVAYGG